MTAVPGCRGAPPAGPHHPRVEVQGHRGCRGLRPENTLAAFQHAIRLGVDVLELDLGLTRDGVLVVIHDPEVDPGRCRGVESLPTRLVRDLSYAQLRGLDCGALPNPRFPEQRPVPGQRIPRLEQVLDLLQRHPRLGANIEIKTSADHPELTRDPAEFARILVSQMRQRGLERRIVIQSFDPRALQAVRRIDGGIVLSALADQRADFASMLRTTGARILSPRHTELRQEDVAALHRRGVRVMPWTVNEPPRMRELLAWGVDGIITDRPDLLLEILGRRGSKPAR